MSSATARVAAAMLRTRWLVRTPIWVFRARLGAIFGGRLLMLEHKGRRTGRRRYVTLEVVDHPGPDTYVVVSGFGERSQWFRNVTADPNVRVWIGSHAPAPATAIRLDAAEAASTLTMYAQAHPSAWANLRPVLEQTLGHPADVDSTDLPVIALELSTRSGGRP
jgi:deazaflavin-dependent oxidoreductase (nitroreductase family)